jgi:hypothetical protein
MALGLALLLALLSPLALKLIVARRGFAVTPPLLIGGPLLGLLALAPWLIDRMSGGRLARFLGLRREFAHLVATTALLAGGLVCWGQIQIDRVRTIEPFARDLGKLVRAHPDASIAAYREHRAQLLFYGDLPVPITVIKKPAALMTFLQSPKAKILILTESDRDEALSVLPPAVREHPVLSEKVQPWEKPGNKLQVWLVGANLANETSAAK